MRFIFLSILLFSFINLYGQKPVIDTSSFKKWPTLGFPGLSDNGKFIFYTIHNKEFEVDTLVVQSIGASWKLNIPNVKTQPICFTKDSKHIAYITKDNVLHVHELGSSRVRLVANVGALTIPDEGIRKWLVYEDNMGHNKVVAINLNTGEERAYEDVAEFLLSRDGQIMILKRHTSNKPSEQILEWIMIETGERKQVYKGEGITNLIIDNLNKQAAFLEKHINGEEDVSKLWYYNAPMNKLELLSNDLQNVADTNLIVDRVIGFSKDCSQILLYLKEPERRHLNNDKDLSVNIWSYTDSKLQSLQKHELGVSKNFFARVDIKNKSLLQIEFENEHAIQINDKYMLIEHRAGDAHNTEASWNPLFKKTHYLFNINNGEKKLLKELNDFNINISPEGKYLIYFNTPHNSYFSYEIASGITRNITSNITAKWHTPYASYAYRGLAGWQYNDAAVIVYSMYDIWEIDPKGLKKPKNLTNSWGEKNSTVFSIQMNCNDKNQIDISQLKYVSGFNIKNKKDGFFRIDRNHTKDPIPLVQEDCIFDLSKSGQIPTGNFTPIKIPSTGGYLIRRSSPKEFGNYYFTMDFKKLIPLTNIQPEKSYNWYTTELHTWKAEDDTVLQGILYKPEDFDPHKKYPLIFKYYDKKSDGLNLYIKPDYLENGANINIPYYVSNGYLIVAVDIAFKTGEVGQSVLNAVMSAAKYFSQMPFVDANKLGINGFSFGGYHTYFLVTHSEIFAAACSGGGQTDIISNFGSLKGSGVNPQEIDQLNMGATLWDRPDLYIKNSPIFKAKEVNTPLLILHNPKDDAVIFSQAIEFFTALRRLGKKAWLIEYEGQGHGVSGKAAIDYSMRQKQFFDHYLMGKPSPIWMTRGIPAARRGIDTGLEYDKECKTPGPGLTDDGKPIVENKR